MSEVQDTLERAPRCVLAATGPNAPRVCAALFWWDGAGIWLSGPALADVIEGLRQDAHATVYVPAAPGTRDGVIVRGGGRVFGPQDPVGLVRSGPAVGAALTALALKSAPLLAGYVRGLVRLPAIRWPAHLQVVRVSGDAVEAVAGVVDQDTDGGRAAGGPRGMAPPLPSVVPPTVRRVLSGRRDVVVATAAGTDPDLRPATWSAGMRLETRDPLPEGAQAAVVVDEVHHTLVLEGSVHKASLVPERVRWWDGPVGGTAAVPAPLAGGVELPD